MILIILKTTVRTGPRPTAVSATDDNSLKIVFSSRASKITVVVPRKLSGHTNTRFNVVLFVRPGRGRKKEMNHLFIADF